MLRTTPIGLTAILLLAGPALAQEQAPPPAATIQPSDVDAAATREQLGQLLDRHPSEVGRVFAMAPQLLGNEEFMAPYPALKAFLTQHPEVAANPAYFFSGYSWRYDDRPATVRFWEDVLGALAAAAAIGFAALILIWLIKTVIEQRRWSRLQRLQAEVHQKVLDRLGTNEQLIAYMETPAGRRFLESAPIPLEGPRPISAPVGRVLWSMQVGVVLVFAGLGIIAASRQLPAPGDTALFVVGIATLAVGVGFTVSSLASFLLSRRLGLMQPEPSTEP